MHIIRRLDLGEGLLYREVRLEALQDSPGAFATSYESALERDAESWAAQADASADGEDRATFLVFFEGRPVGLVALYRGPDQSPAGELVQMWIAPGHRGGSVATDLLDHLFGWAAGHGFDTIRAEIAQGNPRALRFYGKYGFRPVISEGGNTLLEKEIAREII